MNQDTVVGCLAVKILVALQVFSVAFIAPAALAQQKKPADIPANIPIEAFAALPSFSGGRISPNGTKIAYFTEMEGQRHVVVHALASMESAFRIPSPEVAHFSTIRWANNEHVLVQARMSRDRFASDSVTTQSRWYSIDLTNKNFVWLGKPKRGQHELASQLERLIDILPEDDDHILLQLDFNLNGETEVYKTNIVTGARRVRRPPVKGVQNWYVDQTSDVRLGTGYDGRRWVTKLKDKKGFWKNLEKTDWGSNYTVAGFAKETGKLYVTGQSQYGTKGLYLLDLQTETIIETIYENKTVDIDYAIDNPATGEIYGVVYTKDFPRTEYLDPQRVKIKALIDKVLPNTVNTILREITSKRWYFLRAESDRNDGEYYIYSAKSNRLKRVAQRRPNLDSELMASVRAVSIPVRDGTNIPGYLTVPNGLEDQNLPTIILPHGGPTARDTASWDYEAQFYASRGYLVLKPNFRGSSGYGTVFQRKGENQWGGLMQDDVTDATKWLIREGYADPERICIVGASYGGYAALMGVIKESELYKCAASVNGVTNLPELKSEDRRFIGGRNWVKTMGLTGAKDKQVSPYHRAAEINVPILLMSSVDDARIPWEMSQDMHKRLKKLKKNSTYVKIEKGTHNMVTAQSRLTMLKATEKFLAEHIGN